MPIEKLSRWSGLAAVLGGALFVYMMVYEVPVDDNRLLWTLLPMVCLWIVALASLFRRLPAASSPGSKTTFAVAMIGLLLLLAGLFSFYTAGPDLPWYLLGIGFYGLAIGIVGMGIIALIQRVLGPWRFVPLLLGGVLLGFMVTATVPSSPEALYQVFIVLNGISWLLLGIALWSTHREPQDPGLLA